MSAASGQGSYFVRSCAAADPNAFQQVLRDIASVQLLQPLSQFIPGGQASHTTLTVWDVDSQKGQYVADPKSQLQNPLCRLRIVPLDR